MDAEKVSCEGGTESAKVKSDATYRAKCNFDMPRSPRFNKGHLKCQRLFGAFLVTINLAMSIPLFISNASGLLYALAFYSIWGTMSALIALLSSVIAMDTEGWFKFAYIATEVSFAINIVVFLIFWIVLWPMVLA